MKRISSALASGLAIDASAYPKPGNVSPLGGSKGLEHRHFTAAASALEAEFHLILVEGKRCGGLGEKIYRAYRAGAEASGGRNVHLGFVILSIPVLLSAGDTVLGPVNGKAPSETLSMEILRGARDLVERCGDPEDVAWISKTIVEASPSYLSRYEGPGFDVRNPGRGTIMDFIRASKDHDLIALEMWEGYPRTLEAAQVVEEMGEDPREGAVVAFIQLASKSVDTNIARGRGYRVAAKFVKEARKLLEIMLTGSDLWRGYAEDLDAVLRRTGINPGSVADIVALAAGLYTLNKVLWTKGAEDRVPF